MFKVALKLGRILTTCRKSKKKKITILNLNKGVTKSYVRKYQEENFQLFFLDIVNKKRKNLKPLTLKHI